MFEIKRPDQIIDQSLAFFAIHLREVVQPPLDGGQLFHMGDAQEFPVGLAALERREESAVLFRHLANKLGYERLSRLQQVTERHGLFRHALEATGKFLFDIDTGGS